MCDDRASALCECGCHILREVPALHRAAVDLHDAALAVNQDSCWQADLTRPKFPPWCGKRYRIRHLHVRHKLTHARRRIAALIHCNAHDRQSLGGVLARDGGETRHLLAAWLAPRCPIVDQHHLPPMIGELPLAAIAREDATKGLAVVGIAMDEGS